MADANALMAEFCGWPVSDAGTYTMESATYTAHLRPRPGERRVLDIPHGLITAITSAHMDPSWNVSIASAYGAAAEVAAGYRVLDARARELWLGSTATPYSIWRTDARANRVIYVGGFAADAPEILPIAADAVRHLLERPRVGSAVAISQGGQSVTRSDSDALLPASVRNALAPWVVWSSRVG